MTLRPFRYMEVSLLKQAVMLMQEYKDKAALVAGGTDLFGTLKDAIHQNYPEVLINLKTINGLRYVEADAKGVRIGALTPIDTIAKHPLILDTYPLLAEAARSVASPQIRNVGTIAGNLCQEPRCWYYRNPGNMFYCLRKGGKKCNALFGENRYHSIFGGMCVSAPPCASNCPCNINIPEYMNKIRSGDLLQAARILLRNNPIPSITGRVCPHYCESDCNRTDSDDAVSIRDVERFIGDYILEHSSDYYRTPRVSTNKKVAIVGGGPAGLTAAYFLRKSGHDVVVFEKMSEAGGQLLYSIPDYRLPKNIVRTQIRALEEMGICFEPGVSIGSNEHTLMDLRTRYDSVFLATGLWNQKNLKMEKEELLTSGLDFLKDVNLSKVSSVGRKVLVIGGGNVAVDVAITALRLGAKEVTITCLESRETMPAFPEDLKQALQEGVKVLPSWGPHRIIEQHGKLKGMEFFRCTSVFDQEGHFSPIFDLQVNTVLEADQIILAIGQSADLSYVGPGLKIERGLIISNEETKATNIKGVFAGGEVSTGPSSIVESIAAGRNAAVSICEYLSGLKEKNYPTHKDSELIPLNVDALKMSNRVKALELPLSRRTIDEEDHSTLTQQEVTHEADRCVNCGCVAVNVSDIAVALIALEANIKTTKRTITAEKLFAANQLKTTVLEEDELIEEINIPFPSPSSTQRYLKFRLRNSIDFPIVSIAYLSTMKDRKFQDVTIVCGAVAPVPLRMSKIETFLKGRTPSEYLVEDVGALVFEDTKILARNKFKATILKGLLRKAILTTG